MGKKDHREEAEIKGAHSDYEDRNEGGRKKCGLEGACGEQCVKEQFSATKRGGVGS